MYDNSPCFVSKNNHFINFLSAFLSLHFPTYRYTEVLRNIHVSRCRYTLRICKFTLCDFRCRTGRENLIAGACSFWFLNTKLYKEENYNEGFIGTNEM